MISITVEIPDDLKFTLDRQTENYKEYIEDIIVSMLKRFRKQYSINAMQKLVELPEEDQKAVIDVLEEKQLQNKIILDRTK